MVNDPSTATNMSIPSELLVAVKNIIAGYLEEYGTATFVELAKIIREQKVRGAITISNSQIKSGINQLVDSNVLVKEATKNIFSLGQNHEIETPDSFIPKKQFNSLEDILSIAIDPIRVLEYFNNKGVTLRSSNLDITLFAAQINMRIHEFGGNRYILCPIPRFLIAEANIETGIAISVHFDYDMCTIRDGISGYSDEDIWNGFHANAYQIALETNEFWISSFNDGLTVHPEFLGDRFQVSPREMAIIFIHYLLNDLASGMQDSDSFIDNRIYLQIFEQLPEYRGDCPAKRRVISAYFDFLASVLDSLTDARDTNPSKYEHVVEQFLIFLFGNDKYSTIWIQDGFWDMIDANKLKQYAELLFEHLLTGKNPKHELDAIRDAMDLSDYIETMPKKKEPICRAFNTVFDERYLKDTSLIADIGKRFFNWSRDNLDENLIARANNLLDNLIDA